MWHWLAKGHDNLWETLHIIFFFQVSIVPSGGCFFLFCPEYIVCLLRECQSDRHPLGHPGSGILLKYFKRGEKSIDSVKLPIIVPWLLHFTRTSKNFKDKRSVFVVAVWKGLNPTINPDIIGSLACTIIAYLYVNTHLLGIHYVPNGIFRQGSWWIVHVEALPTLININI